MGGEVPASHRDEPTESEQEAVAALADQLVAEFPEVPEDYVPGDRDRPLMSVPAAPDSPSG